MTHAEVRVVDADQPRSADRSLVQVAVGVLVRADGAFLLTSRPEGKAYAGYWEFPGGKLEAGETIEEALHRELQEEIGITIQNCELWRTERIDYPHALVQLTHPLRDLAKARISVMCLATAAGACQTRVAWYGACVAVVCTRAQPSRKHPQRLRRTINFIARVCFRNLHRLAVFDRVVGALRWPKRRDQCFCIARHRKGDTGWLFRNG